MTGNVHHTITHSCSAEHTDSGNDDDGLYLSSLGSYGRVHEIHSVIAHPHTQVEDGKRKQENDNSQIDCFHTVVVNDLFLSGCKSIAEI